MSADQSDSSDDGPSGFSNPEFVEESRENLRQEEINEQLSSAEALEVKRQLEQKRKDESQTVMIEVEEGLEIEFERLGFGETTDMPKEILMAEREGNDLAAIAAIDKMVQRLADKSVEPCFDREFWNPYENELIKDVYGQLARSSRGGDPTGK